MQKLRFSIRLTVVSIFVLATILTAAVATGLQYHFSRQAAVDSALAQYRLTAAGTRDYLAAIDSKASQNAAILSRFPELIKGKRVNPAARELFAEVMRSNPYLYAIYVGFNDGNFYELVNLDASPLARGQFTALPDDRWVVISVETETDGRFRSVAYYDDKFKHRASRRERSDYDPRERPWYRQAVTGSVEKTTPYLFQHLQAPGQTYSTVIPATQAVLAIDIALSSLSNYLAELPLSTDGEMYIYQHEGEIVATNRVADSDALPVAEVIPLSEWQKQYLADLGTIRVSNELDWPPIDYAVSGEPKGYAIDLLRLLAEMTGIKIEFINGYTWAELLNMFKNGELDILQPVVPTEANQALGLLSRPILHLPDALVTRDDAATITQLEQLNGKVLAIPAGWSTIQALRSAYPRITLLETGSSRESLAAVISGQAFATLDSAAILHYTADQYFMEHLRFHEHFDKNELVLPEDLNLLIDKRHGELASILDQALAAVPPAQIRALEAKWFGQHDANRTDNNLAVVPYPQLLPRAETENSGDRFFNAEIGGKDHFVYITRLNRNGSRPEYFAAVLPAAKMLVESLRKVTISLLVSVACLLLLLPVSWLFASPIVRPIKSLARENDKIKHRRYDEVAVSDSIIIEIDELSHSIIDMAAAIQQYEREQKALMEAIIRLIAQAIDEKSPYTAGHCARVPVLALMLAEAAEHTASGPFKDFRFNSEDELREYRIAAWLHDCGKITTPEHIVDKATKLEIIYNRIHEIRMRFEVLWRDADIEYLAAPSAETARIRDIKQAQLQEDFAFIAQTNMGGEYLADRDIERLQTLSRQTWLRHFDDRLGLSANELERYPTEQSPLPALEPLLGDKPEHLLPRLGGRELDPKLGIRMEIPEFIYNHGELYNLSISRGTLTEEDRFKINAHMISTIKMLESLPFPKDLARVPRYASTHHETLIGTGYPRRLGDDDLSIPERILAIADIFEALTAADRPYKEPKPLSEALQIMQSMVEEQHIDAEVFELFLTSGVYLDYGKRFLQPAQLDCPDISRFLRRPSAESLESANS
ncbi:MAG: transporter substrate-binding domain-containing protein [Methylomonas sp.]|uniref:HD domain-containing phosphohydrolase n=1 Tax=Methylomonas sp. TaxID=418 RepID=UPI0025F35186|nr:HD domain-containing phosphohydrolase [Methylomonas sp.]MCK9605688.1 transporter substrate-binding domain-containing protein [Methylomonas sp.]